MTKTFKFRFIFPLLAAFLLLGFGEICLAETDSAPLEAQITASELGVAEPQLLPDNPFYFLKNWARNINIAFTFDNVKKAELESRFSNEKILELQKMSNNGANSENMKKAAENYQKAVEKVKNATDRIKDNTANNTEIGKFLDKFANQQILQEKIMQRLESQVHADILQKIKDAREQHLEKFKDVMTKLESNNDRTVERIENALINSDEGNQSQGSSGILDRIKEKMPEPMQQKLESIKENVREKVNNKLIEKATGKNQEKNCPQVLPAVGFCRDGIVKVQRDQKGCATGFVCIKPSEQKLCTDVYLPVCGRNGKTYSNKCVAKNVEIEIAFEGECAITEKKCRTDDDCPKLSCGIDASGIRNCPAQFRCINGKCAVPAATN